MVKNPEVGRSAWAINTSKPESQTQEARPKSANLIGLETFNPKAKFFFCEKPKPGGSTKSPFLPMGFGGSGT